MSDQTKGLVLAISSSIFIGSSYIIKKKGLRLAAVSGIRAGAPRTMRCIAAASPVAHGDKRMLVFQVLGATHICCSHYGGEGCSQWLWARLPTLQRMHLRRQSS